MRRLQGVVNAIDHKSYGAEVFVTGTVGMGVKVLMSHLVVSPARHGESGGARVWRDLTFLPTTYVHRHPVEL